MLKLKKSKFLILTGMLLALVIILGACSGTTPPAEPTSTTDILLSTTLLAYPIATEPIQAESTGAQYPQPTEPFSANTATPTVLITTNTGQITATPSKTFRPASSVTATPNSPTATQTNTPESLYPGPGSSPTAGVTQGYPGPQPTNTPQATGKFTPTSTKATPTAQASVTGTLPAGTQTTPQVTPGEGSVTPTAYPTELPLRPPISPPPPGSAVTIWYSWNDTEVEMLRFIIQSFQKLYPDVTFTLLYIPQDDLYNTYYEAAYLGKGPSILLGPATWGPKLFRQGLISDLATYIPEDFFSSINTAALASGQDGAAVISLPLSENGYVLFRNTSIISAPAESFEELISLAQRATKGGVVGSYLERGANISAANLIGLGGTLFSEDAMPAFDNSFGLEWIELLRAYDEAGAVTFNTNNDLNMFERGRVGFIIESTWNINRIAQSIGAENLAIDPWPTYGTGHMAGWMSVDSMYLNSNAQDSDRFAALSFMGYLLDPNVQMRLAEVGHIPVVNGSLSRDPIMREAMEALSDGVLYPTNVDENILSVYWNDLDKAIKNIFRNGAQASNELKITKVNIIQILKAMQYLP